MTTEMKSMGELFKNKREEMNLSLKEVENATSIRMMYLQAIEEGHVDKFLSSVYALGFVKQYAGFLGFDHEKIVKEFPKALAPRQEKQEFAYGLGTLEVRGSSHGRVKWLPNLMWAGVSAAAIFAAYLFAKLLGVV